MRQNGVRITTKWSKTYACKRFKRRFAVLLVSLVGVVSLAAPANAGVAFSWWNWAFYGGQAHYSAPFTNYSNGMISLDTPRVGRGKVAWDTVCDYQAAIQFYVNGYWYGYDYSSFHSGCTWLGGFFDFWGWQNTTVPSGGTYTHGWWQDVDTGGWKLVGNGWVNI